MAGMISTYYKFCQGMLKADKQEKLEIGTQNRGIKWQTSDKGKQFRPACLFLGVVDHGAETNEYEFLWEKDHEQTWNPCKRANSIPEKPKGFCSWFELKRVWRRSVTRLCVWRPFMRDKWTVLAGSGCDHRPSHCSNVLPKMFCRAVHSRKATSTRWKANLRHHGGT